MKTLLIWLITLYKNTISRIFPSACRFYPTCSQYTKQAIEKYGALKGSFMGLKRLAKCHPFHPGGIDPVK
ncbi:MAG: membrane protein insertion efficiency factor YidD [bacterium]